MNLAFVWARGSLTSLLRHVPLTSGPTPLLLGGAALVLVLATLAGRHWARGLAVAALAATGTVLVARVSLPASVDAARIPASFYVWAWLPPFAAALAVWAWRRRPRRLPRLAAVLAVPFTVAFAANEVNAWFAYVPTAADLAGLPVPYETDLAHPGAAARATGAIVRLDLAARASGFRHRRALVYLPPSALGAQPHATGVVMMLAGTPGQPDDLVRAAGIGPVAVRYTQAHGGSGPIIVFPDHNGSFGGDTECVDSARGNAETYLTVDVPRDLGERFGVAASGWGILGYSEGGTCAVTLALRHPALFGAFVDISGDPMANLGSGPARDRAALRDLFGGDPIARAAHDPAVLLSLGHYNGLAGWFLAGTGDPPAVRAAERLAPLARQAGIDTLLRTPAGHHSYGLVRRSMPDAFAFLARREAPPLAG